MIIAITVVFPAPVAILQARIGLGFGVLDLLAERLGFDLGEPDQRLDRLALAGEQLALAVRVAAVQQKVLRFRCDAPLPRRQFVRFQSKTSSRVSNGPATTREYFGLVGATSSDTRTHSSRQRCRGLL